MRSMASRVHLLGPSADGELREVRAVPVAPGAAGLMAIAQLGSIDGKVPIMKSGSQVTTSTVPFDLVTLTVAAGRIFYLSLIMLTGSLTSIPGDGNRVLIGTWQLDAGGPPALLAARALHPDFSPVLPFSEPVPLPGPMTLRLRVTPSSVSSIAWHGNLVGYEREA